MGWTVHDVKAASVWEFFSAFAGYVDANTPKQSGKLSEDEKDRIWERMRELETPIDEVLSTETYRLNGMRLVPNGRVNFRSDRAGAVSMPARAG